MTSLHKDYLLLTNLYCQGMASHTQTSVTHTHTKTASQELRQVTLLAGETFESKPKRKSDVSVWINRPVSILGAASARKQSSF